MQAKMTDHLGYEKHAPEGRGLPNSRNGTRTKTLKTDQGEVDIEVPRDRDGTFEPQLVKKRQTRFTGFDERILALYARGMTVREIQGHLLPEARVQGFDLVGRVDHAADLGREVEEWHNPLPVGAPGSGDHLVASTPLRLEGRGTGASSSDSSPCSSKDASRRCRT